MEKIELIIIYVFTAGMGFASALKYYQLETAGVITTKDGMPATGGDAKFITYGLIITFVIMACYSIFITLSYLRKKKTN